LNARAKFSANGGNAHGRNKALCFFLPPYINLKLPANLEAVAAKPLCSYIGKQKNDLKCSIQAVFNGCGIRIRTRTE